jgi:prophage tail gpP-like protein
VTDLTLTVGGAAISGWTTIRVTRGIEICPSSFAVTATSDSPIYADAVGIQPGAPCTVALGSALVITGYVDAVQPRYDANAHDVMIIGRGRCADLVDCSAEVPGGQIGNAKLLDIANKLGSTYGITATAQVDTGEVIPQFNVNVGETPWSIIERIARQEAVLAYEDTDGNLIFAQAGTTMAASGFVEGQNVLAASVTRSIAERYQSYFCSLTSVFNPLDIGGPSQFFGQQTDPNVTRPRTLFLVAEQVQGSVALVQRKAVWEMNRRYGRGNAVNVVVDSWDDAGGTLWTPNTLVPVTLPRLGMPTTTLCVGEVTYLRDAQGTRSEVSVAPKEAYLPEPIQLQPVLADVTPATTTGATGL